MIDIRVTVGFSPEASALVERLVLALGRAAQAMVEPAPPNTVDAQAAAPLVVASAVPAEAPPAAVAGPCAPPAPIEEAGGHVTDPDDSSELPAAAEGLPPVADVLSNEADDALPAPVPAQTDESFFASFSPEKEELPSPAPAVDLPPSCVLSDAYPWRTAARRAVLEADYPAGVPMMDIRRTMEALPGAPLPRGNDLLWRWVTIRGLKRGVAPTPVVPPEPEPEAAPVALLPEGEVRETPQLKRARELLAMGVHPNDIKGAVRLSVAEFAIIRAEHGAA